MIPAMQTPATESAYTPSADHPVVLLVDPQVLVAEALRRLLADEPDIEFHACQNPYQALAKAVDFSPTVIFLEPALNTADMDGYALLTAYRNNPATAETPIVMLSLQDDPHAKRRAFEQGASDYLVKLPDGIEMVARIRAYTKTCAAQRQRAQTLQDMQRALEAFKSAAES